MFRIVLLQKVEEFLSPSVVNLEIEKKQVNANVNIWQLTRRALYRSVSIMCHYNQIAASQRENFWRWREVSRFTSSILGDLTETKKSTFEDFNQQSGIFKWPYLGPGGGCRRRWLWNLQEKHIMTLEPGVNPRWASRCRPFVNRRRRMAMPLSSWAPIV